MVKRRKPWRLSRSILKEAFPFISLSFLILTTLVFVQQIGKYSNIVLSFQASSKMTLTFVLSLIPGIVIITLPVSLLLGTVIACSRLSADSELTAAQSLGVSRLSLALPFILYGLIGTVLTSYLSAEIAPRALKQLKSMRARVLLQEASTQIRPHMFITSFPDVLLYVQDVDPATGDWLGVFIVQQDQGRGIYRLLTSERGQLRIMTTPRMALEAQLYSGLSMEDRLSNLKDTKPVAEKVGSQAASVFEKLSIKLTEKDVPEEERDAPAALSEMTIGEVGWAIRTAPSPRERLRARVEWHKRFAFPFACLTLTCVTFIVAMRGRRFSTRPRTVVAILFIAMGFYLVLVSGQNLAQSGKIPVWLGVWLSNMLLGAYIIKSFVTSRQLMSFPLFPALRGLAPSTGVNNFFRSLGQSDGSAAAGSGPPRFGLINLVNLINYLIVSEIAKYYLLALSALVMTSIIFTLFDLIPAMARSGSGVGYAAIYLAYLAPQFAYYVSPFALLVAVMTGCSVLLRTNQFVTIYSAGLSKSRITAAIMAASLLLGVGLWLVSDYILPHTNREQDVRYHRIKGRQLEQTTIAFGKKWVYGKNNTIYSYQRIDPDNSLLNASIYRLSPNKGTLEKASHFNQARQISDFAWKVQAGWSDVIKPDLTIERLPLHSESDPIRIEDGAGLFKRTVNESSKMSAEDLSEYISQLKSIGVATTELQLDFRKRIAFPFSCLTLSLLAVPFAMARRARRSSTLISVAIGVGIGLIFWLLMTIFEAAGKQSSLPVSLSVWGPQILFLALALYLNFRRRSN